MTTPDQTPTPPAGAAAAPPTPPPAAAPTAPPSGDSSPSDWTTGLNDDLKGYVQTKGFKDTASAIDSYRNLEKLMGAPKERLLKLPEKEDDPAWKDIYKRLGTPDTPDAYKVESKVGADPEFSKWAKSAFHEMGLTMKQAEGLASKFNEYSTGLTTKFQTDAQVKAQESAASLKKDWGLAHDQNVALAKKAAAAFGVTPDTIDQLEKQIGYAGVMKHFQAIGSKMGEDSFTSGDNTPSGFGVMSPEQAKSRISILRGDSEFVAKYAKGDATAKLEMDKLHAWAYPPQG